MAAAPKHSQLLERLLAKLVGEMHIYVTLGERRALEVSVQEKSILIEILNPVIAAELGLEQWLLSRGKKGQPVSRTVERLKSQGYTIAVKYKLFKVIL